MEKRFLCRLDEIEDPGSRGFDEKLSAESGSGGFFIVRRGNEAFAYLNSCPHTKAPLEWLPDQFLDQQREYIQCSLHGALFSLDTGYCLRGPCAGDALTPLVVSVENGDVYLLLK